MLYSYINKLSPINPGTPVAVAANPHDCHMSSTKEGRNLSAGQSNSLIEV